MIDFDILKKFGTTNHAIKTLFTSKAGEKDERGVCLHEKRTAWENRIESRIFEGLQYNLRNYRIYAVSDLAWDGQPITKEIIPLMQYAQGRINFKSLETQIKDLPVETQKKFCDIDEQTKEIKSVSLSKFHEVWVNLVRSFTSRRTATLAVNRLRQTPFFKYEPTSTSFVAKLRGDVLSQRVEVMTNQYGYRHDAVQVIRDMLLYAHTVEVASGAWDVEQQLVKKKRPKAEDTSNDEKFETESKVVREGVSFARPHPTRTFHDTAYPLASINTDTGCQYLGYWNISRYREINQNTAFFNRGSIEYNRQVPGLIDGNRPFFELYYPDAAIKFPTVDGDRQISTLNDREQNIGLYSSEKGDDSVMLVEYREKVIPKEVGLGDYPYPVWVRLVVAGAHTVVFGEILPSTPGVYYGYNEDDSRQVNLAFAHEAMPWQDQASNLLTQLLQTQKAGLIKVLIANLDILEPKMVEEIRAIIKGERYTVGPMLLEISGDKLQELGLRAEDAFRMVEAAPSGDITIFFRSVMQLMQLAERVLNVSPQELGQTAQHEISATESTQITDTTNTLAAYMGLGLDEGFAAKKRLIYEALIALGEDRTYAPVVNRYLPKTIKAAGFEIVPEEDEADTTENLQDDNHPRSVTVLGTKSSLIYDYTFTQRDDTERSSNAKSAEVLVNLLAQMLQIPNFVQDLGKERLYLFLNHIVRMSGAGVDLQFGLAEGESQDVPLEDGADQNKAEIQETIKQIIGIIEQQKQQIAALTGAVQGQVGAMPSGIPQSAPQPAAAPAAM